ncbi:DUF3224 domain-containing protein [Ciceribacter selenitireducens]
MRVRGTFKTTDFKATSLAAEPPVETALAVGVQTMQKHYSGNVAGRSSTLFTSAFDPALGVGSYVAMESFEGAIGDRVGTFNFLHSASARGKERRNEFFAIVEGSGTGDLKGLTGSGGIAIDPDETHHIWFDIEFAP